MHFFEIGFRLFDELGCSVVRKLEALRVELCLISACSRRRRLVPILPLAVVGHPDESAVAWRTPACRVDPFDGVSDERELDWGVRDVATRWNEALDGSGR